jgi:hypothetical protein
MADINTSGRVVISKGNLSDAILLSGAFSFAVTYPTMSGGVASIGTSAHEALPLQDVATPGLAWFKNLDGTNYVEVGSDVAGTFYPFLKLKPAQECWSWLSVAPYAKANTAACQLQFKIYNA